MIAIHHKPGSFSTRWIEYCNKHCVQYKQVNCHSSSIIEDLRDCDGLLWHWEYNDYRARLFARQLTYSLEAGGKRVFPNSRTCWHYDDKIGQKYFLESIGAPLVPSYVFYEQKTAMEWAKETDYPKVFKLRSGAGSTNVLLVRTRAEAARLIKKAFKTGFGPVNRFAVLRDVIQQFRRCRNAHTTVELAKALIRCLVPGVPEKHMGREKDYAYFQDFLPDNAYDTRLVVIGARCFGIRRQCRKGDFRASGSGLLSYGRELFHHDAIRKAFEVAESMGSQSVAFDFLIDRAHEPKIGEISYCFTLDPYEKCPGYWDRDLNWHDGFIRPTDFIIEDFLASISAHGVVVSKEPGLI